MFVNDPTREMFVKGYRMTDEENALRAADHLVECLKIYNPKALERAGNLAVLIDTYERLREKTLSDDNLFKDKTVLTDDQ